jgi:hypothetical protein
MNDDNLFSQKITEFLGDYSMGKLRDILQGMEEPYNTFLDIFFPPEPK